MASRNLERGSRVCHRASSRALPFGREVESRPSRPCQAKPSSPCGLEANLSDDLILLKQDAALTRPAFEQIRYFAQDESRFGLKTTVGRLLTRLGVKPLGHWQWQFKAFWLDGAVEPTTGEQCFLQFTPVDSECYQLFLDQFAQAYPDSLNILQVDNGAFHKAKALVMPANIMLLFQPPYCPELNPIERLWQHLKKALRWALFKHLTQLQTKVDKLLLDLTTATVASVTGFSFIVDALSVAGLF